MTSRFYFSKARFVGALGVALATCLTASIASAETTGGPGETGETTGGPVDTTGGQTGGILEPSVSLEIAEGPYIASETIAVTVSGDGGSTTVGSLALLVDGADSGLACEEGSTSCLFELSLEAGSHDLQGQVVADDGGEAETEILTIEVDPAEATSGGQTGGEQTGGEQTGGEQTGGEQTSGATGSGDEDSSGCRVGGSGAPVGPLAVLFALGFWTRRRN